MDSKALRSLTTAANSTNRAFERANLSAAQLHQHLHGIQATAGAMGAAGLLGGRGGGGGMHGGRLHVGAGGVGLGAAGFAMGDLFWPAAAGVAAFAGLKGLYGPAKDLNTEQARFRLLGLSEAQNQDAFAFSKGLNIFGTSQIDRLSAMREAQGVFRETGLSGSAALAGARLATPVLSKLDFLGSTLDEESREKLHTSNLSMLRFIESAGGLKSPEAFNSLADQGYKLYVSSGGAVDWEQLRQMQARGGVAAQGLTGEARARLEPEIAELKGGAVGFGLSTGFNRLTGVTRVPNQVAHELADSGIWDSSAIEWNKMGGIKRFTRDSGPLSKDKLELLSTDPVQFYQNVIHPMYDRMKLDAAEIGRQNVMIFGRTDGALMNLIEKQNAVIANSVKAYKAAMGIDPAAKLAGQTLTGAEQEFDKAWTDFKTNYGTLALPFFTKVLQMGSQLLRMIPTPSKDTVNSVFDIGARFMMPGHRAMDAITKPAVDWLINNTATTTTPFAGKGGTRIVLQLNADAKKMGLTLTPTFMSEMSKPLGGPQSGINLFDPTSMPIPAGGF